MTTLVIETDTLRAALDSLSYVALHRSDVPSLSHVALEISHLGLTLTCTDVTAWLRIGPLICTTSGDAALTVPLANLRSYIAGQPSGSEIELTAEVAYDPQHRWDGGALLIRAPTGRAKIPALPLDQFQQLATDLDAPALDSKLVVNGRDLAANLDFAMATADSGRHALDYLSGVHITPADGPWPDTGTPCLRFVSTDRKRLSLLDIPLPDPDHWREKAIVPARSVEIMRKLATDAPDPITLYGVRSANKVKDGIHDLRAIGLRDKTREFVFVTLLVAQNFPHYLPIITIHERTASAAIDPSLLAGALKRLLAIVHDPVAVVFEADQADGGGALRLYAYDTAGARARELVSDCRITGKIHIGLNPRHTETCISDITGLAEMALVLRDPSAEPMALWTDSANPQRARFSTIVRLTPEELRDAAA